MSKKKLTYKELEQRIQKLELAESENRLIKEALQHNIMLLEAQLKSFIDGILVVDTQGKKIFQNQKTIELFKIPEHIAESDDDKTHAQHFMQMIRKPGPFFEKITNLYKHQDQISRDEIELIDGTVLDCYSAPVTGKDGQNFGRLWTFRDITDKKKSEEELNRIFELSPDLIGIGNITEGYYKRVNPAYEIFGRPLDEFLSRPYVDFIHPDDHNATASIVRTMQSGQSISGFVNRYRCKDGTYRTIEWRATSAQADGTVYVAGRDITDRMRTMMEKEKLEEQLRQVQKMEAIGRLAGGVAHDFNNMLSIILGNTEMILEDMNLNNPIIVDSLHQIKKATMQSTELVKQLLGFARKQTISPEVLNLNSTLKSMLTMLHRLIGEDVELNFSQKKDLWQVKIDRSQIDQILTNLCVNARYAIKGHGKITIKTDNILFDNNLFRDDNFSNLNEFVMLSVSDDGFGIEKKNLDKIFEPFFTTKPVGHGSGLGLATVYGIVKQNNGFIKVYSEPEKGTVFKIYLPRYYGVEVRRKRKPDYSSECQTGNETILLVEDEKNILKMTTMMLERLGYNVIAVRSPGDAIKICQSGDHAISLLMTDVIMPEMSGKELAEKLFLMQPNIKCLFMSGYTADVIANHGILEKGVHFISKPFGKQNLAQMLREIFDGKNHIT